MFGYRTARITGICASLSCALLAVVCAVSPSWAGPPFANPVGPAGGSLDGSAYPNPTVVTAQVGGPIGFDEPKTNSASVRGDFDGGVAGQGALGWSLGTNGMNSTNYVGLNMQPAASSASYGTCSYSVAVDETLANPGDLHLSGGCSNANRYLILEDDTVQGAYLTSALGGSSTNPLLWAFGSNNLNGQATNVVFAANVQGAALPAFGGGKGLTAWG